MHLSLADYKRLYVKAKPRARTKRAKSKESPGEETLALQLKALNIQYQREFKFCETRKWRADFYLLEYLILVEVEGGIWSQGRHTRGKGYIADMEKYNTAQNLGYRVLRFSTEQVVSGFAIREIERLIKQEGDDVS